MLQKREQNTQEMMGESMPLGRRTFAPVSDEATVLLKINPESRMKTDLALTPGEQRSLFDALAEHEISEIYALRNDRKASAIIVHAGDAEAPIKVFVLGNKSASQPQKQRMLEERPLNVTQCISMSELKGLLDMDRQAMQPIREAAEKFPMKIPRYYARLMMQHDVLRQVVVPSGKELLEYDDDAAVDVHADESKYQPVQGIVHRYPGKLLFFPTLQCFGHCRFCFRSGQRVQPLSSEKIDAALDYIRLRKDVREVLVTGGDPLTLPMKALEDILARIRAIQHVEIIRIGTRALAYAPQVITRRMVDMLARYKPVFMTLSFVHPDEISPYCEQKLNMLADSGIVMLQQGPILKGVNDDAAVLKHLYEKLARNRVLAYYAIYGIFAPGVRHFIVNREEAGNLFSRLENNTSGHCLPHLITLDQNDDKTRSVM